MGIRRAAGPGTLEAARLATDCAWQAGRLSPPCRRVSERKQPPKHTGTDSGSWGRGSGGGNRAPGALQTWLGRACVAQPDRQSVARKNRTVGDVEGS